MQTISDLWWAWLAGMLLCWGLIGVNRLWQQFTNRKDQPDRSLIKSSGLGTNVLVGLRYLGFVFLVLLIFSLAVMLITSAT